MHVNKKGIILLAVFLLVTISSALAADVAYIYRKSSKINDDFLDIFDGLGLTVETINIDGVLFTDFSQYEFIFVGNENFKSKASFIPINEFPAVVANSYHPDEWQWTQDVGQIGSNAPLLAQNLDAEFISDTDEIVQVYTDCCYDTVSVPMYYLPELVSISELVVATKPLFTPDDDAVVAAIKPGVMLMNGQTANANGCFFGITETEFWTPVSEELFINCVGFVQEELIVCNTDADCDDSDSGTIDTCHNPGTIDSFCTNEPVECFDDSECGLDDFVGDPFCSGDDVYQDFQSFMCNDPGTISAYCSDSTDALLIEECAFGCLNGECNEQPPIECSTDGACGTDQFVGDPFCIEDDVYQDFQDFTCNDPGTIDSFCSDATDPSLIEECSFGCSNGECNEPPIECHTDADCDDSNPLTFDQCINPGTPASECRNTPINCASDIDCGFTGFSGENYCFEDDVFKNFQTAICNNPGTLGSYCDLDVTPELINECSYACFEGACINCDEDLDCDDQDLGTIDICHNPGTSESFCTNDPPACNNDAECGLDDFVGNPFCIEDDVYQDFQSFMCNDPGTISAYCSDSTDPLLIEVCSFTCVAGQCTEEPPIECNTDADCGIDGFVGDTFCIEDDVFQDFQEFTCHNPGTPGSFCSDSTDPSLIEACSFTCVDGQCTEEPVECGVRINFNYIKNAKAGDLENRVFVGPTGQEFAENEFIPLTQSGKFIKDSGLIEDVPGISIQRDDERVRFYLYGSHAKKTGRPKGREILAAEITFENAIIKGFENDISNAATFPNMDNMLEDPGNRKYKIGSQLGEDELFYFLGSDTALWFSTVVRANDAFFLKIECQQPEY